MSASTTDPARSVNVIASANASADGIASNNAEKTPADKAWRGLPDDIFEVPQICNLVADVFHHPLWPDLRAVDVARGIGRDAFGRACARGLLHRIGNERRYRAVLGAADADTAFPTVVVLGHRLGFRIRDIDVVLAVDIDAARPAELRPLVEKLAVLVENLNAVVLAVAHEQAGLRVHRDGVRDSPFGAVTTADGALNSSLPLPGVPGLPSRMSTLPSGLNLNT